MKSADKKGINCKGCNFKGWFYYQLSTKCTILSGAVLESCKLAEGQRLQWRIKRKPQGDKQLGGGQEWDPPTVLRILNRQQNKKGWKKVGMRAAPSNFHFPSSYLSHFGWITSRTMSFFFNRNSTSLWWCKSLQALLSLESLLNCSKSDQCSPSFYSIKTGTYREFSFAARKSVQGYHLAEGKGDSMFQSLKVKAAQSGLILCDPMDCGLPGSSVHGDFPDKNIGASCHFLLQGSSHPRNWTQVSCIASRFFTIWATREEFQSLADGFGCFHHKGSRGDFLIRRQVLGLLHMVSCRGFQVGGTLPAVGSLQGCLLPPLCGSALNSFRGRRLANCLSWKGWQKTLPVLFDLPHPNTTLGVVWVQSTQSPHDSPVLTAVTAFFLTRKEMGPWGLSVNL